VCALPQRKARIRNAVLKQANLDQIEKEKKQLLESGLITEEDVRRMEVIFVIDFQLDF
jgi:hypothetical protein